MMPKLVYALFVAALFVVGTSCPGCSDSVVVTPSTVGPIKGISYPAALDEWRLDGTRNLLELHVSRGEKKLIVELLDIEVPNDDSIDPDALDYLKAEWIGKTVAIDNRNPEIMTADTDGSQRAFVYLLSTDKKRATILTVELVRRGFAKTKNPASYKYKYELQAAQKQAQQSKLGIWK